jgi:hypothetical protein
MLATNKSESLLTMDARGTFIAENPPTLEITEAPYAGLPETATPTFIADKVWLARGPFVIYTYDQRVCLKDGSESAVFLSDAGYLRSATASADNKVIVLEKQYIDVRYRVGWQQLSAIDTDTLVSKLIFDTRVNVERDISSSFDATDLIYFDWIPGTHQLIATSGLIMAPMMGNRDLYRLDALTGDVTTIFHRGDGGAEYAVSPDGQTIAYVNSEELGFVAPDGQNWKRNVISLPPLYAGGDALAYVKPVWAQDSSGVWVAVPPRVDDSIGTPADTRMVVWFVPTTGEPIPTGELDMVMVTLPYEPVVTADGQYVSFMGWYQETSGFHSVRLIDGAEVAMPTPTPSPEPQVPDQGCEP